MTDHALRTNRPDPPHGSLPYLLTFPALIALIGILYPFVLGVYYTFTNYTLTEPGNIQWVGLENYVEIFRNIDFWQAFGLTFVFAVSVVLIELALGLGVALLLKDAF
ncbi:MAG: sugar ABC transporter permease, partial [Sedimentisphaerales bacterium]|nr:sugar ABC transporter permease [Sedimentisphaerales bacterium]